ncbi:hypothetical protein PAMP_017772 [Pampus punctatissimus]
MDTQDLPHLWLWMSHETEGQRLVRPRGQDPQNHPGGADLQTDACSQSNLSVAAHLLGLAARCRALSQTSAQMTSSTGSDWRFSSRSTLFTLRAQGYLPLQSPLCQPDRCPVSADVSGVEAAGDVSHYSFLLSQHSCHQAVSPNQDMVLLIIMHQIIIQAFHSDEGRGVIQRGAVKPAAGFVAVTSLNCRS